jgi:hypothetical protein
MIDKIINEWTYQLDSGYPTKESDYEVLRSVLTETNMLSEQEINNTIQKAQGIFESAENSDRIQDDIRAMPKAGSNPIYVATDSQIIINNFNKRSKKFKLAVAEYLSDNNINSDISNEFQNLTIDVPQEDSNSYFNNADQFVEFIMSEYAMEGQQFLGLPLLFEKINKSPNKDKIFSLITDLDKKPLTSGDYKIQGTDADLYQIILETIKVPNGHYSELWFAIKFNGEVKGGVAGDSIVSDVDVGADGVSLKDYEKISTVDFGNLTADTALLLKIAVNSFEMLTGMQINKSMTRDSINAVLDKLDSDELRNDIRGLIQISKDTEIKVIRRFVDKLQRFMPDGDPERIVQNFCEQLNETIKSKLSDGNVKWWGIISRGTLHLKTSNEVYQALKCQNNRISPAVSNFKGFHLFVNGNRINAIVKDIRAAQVEG